MSKRLQVLLDDAELDELRAVADSEGMTVSAWVRQALLHVRRSRSTGNVEDRLAAIRTAADHSFPTGDVADMLDEIERGYLGA